MISRLFTDARCRHTPLPRPGEKRWERIGAAVGALLLTALLLACSAPRGRVPFSGAERPAACASLYRELDHAVDRQKAANAAGFPVPGFPYLRTDRTLAAAAERVRTPEQQKQWLQWMRETEMDLRWSEIRNLSEPAFAGLDPGSAGEGSRRSLMDRVAACGDELLASDAARPGFLPALRRAVPPPDEYRTLYRVLGLYPLAAIPVDLLTVRVRNAFREWFETPLEGLPVRGTLVTYAPQEAAPSPRPDLAALFAAAADNPLSLPRMTDEQTQRLAVAFAPVFQVDEAADYDRPGRIRWKDGRIHVDTEEPVVYYYGGASFLDGRPVVQIHYAIWFPERAGPDPPWIEKGPLDGLTLRISIDERGRPRMIDGMNTCGCYHYFIPPDEPGIAPVAQSGATNAFVPQRMPAGFPEHPLLLRINSGWHQVQRVEAPPATTAHRSYRLLPYERLESLPDGRGGRASLFDENGIAKDSERIEPLLLFPLGVPSVGSMRQRGHHAIVFIGRAHFTDPYLFDRYFRFP